MGAGTIELDGDFKAEQMEVNVGAGTIENSGSLDIKEADFTVGVGTADISEIQVEKLNGSCGMGNMELTLTGKAADYNYELKCGLGNLEWMILWKHPSLPEINRSQIEGAAKNINWIAEWETFRLNLKKIKGESIMSNKKTLQIISKPYVMWCLWRNCENTLNIDPRLLSGWCG